MDNYVFNTESLRHVFIDFINRSIFPSHIQTQILKKIYGHIKQYYSYNVQWVIILDSCDCLWQYEILLDFNMKSKIVGGIEIMMGGVQMRQATELIKAWLLQELLMACLVQTYNDFTPMESEAWNISARSKVKFIRTERTSLNTAARKPDYMKMK